MNPNFCYHKFYIKLFIYYKLLQQSPQANRTIPYKKVPQWKLSVGCRTGVLPSSSWTPGWPTEAETGPASFLHCLPGHSSPTPTASHGRLRNLLPVEVPDS